MHFTSSSGTFEPQSLYNFYSYMFLFQFLYLSSQIGKTFNLIHFASSILIQTVLHFSNNLSSPIWKDINLLFSSLFPSYTLIVSTYALILCNIKSNGLKNSPNCSIKYLELFFVSIKFEITVLSTLTSQLFFFAS